MNSCVCSHWSRHVELGSKDQSEWEAAVEAYAEKYPEEAAEFKQLISGELPDGWDKALPVSERSAAWFLPRSRNAGRSCSLSSMWSDEAGICWEWVH